MIKNFLMPFFLFVCVCFGHIAHKKISAFEESSIVKEIEIAEGEVNEDDDGAQDHYSKVSFLLHQDHLYNPNQDLNSFYKTQLFSRIYSYIRIPQFNKNIPNAPPVLPFLV